MREDSGHMDFILNGEAEIAVPAVDEIRTNEMEISGKVKVRTALELGGNLLIHCLKIQEQAKAMRHELMIQLESQNPPPDKSVDPMVWM